MALVKSCIGVIWMSMLMAGSIAHARGITLEHDPGGSVVSNQKKGFPFALKINAPWKNSGHVLLNLPEHLDHRDGNAGLLHCNDKRVNATSNAWKISADGKTANIRFESPYLKGAWFTGEVKVVGNDTVSLVIRIENKTRIPLTRIRSLYCMHYRLLKGFPSWGRGFPHTYVAKGGKLVALADIKTRNPEAAVKFAKVKGARGPARSAFAERFGGNIRDPLDLSLVVVTALDDKRKVAMQWTPASTMLSNSSIPCVHADPRHPDAKPGEVSEARGVVHFSTAPLDQIFARFKKGDASAAPGVERATSPPSQSATPVGVVSHIKIVSDNVPDVSSMDAVVNSYTSKGMTDEEKVVAIWKAVVSHQHQDTPPKEYLQQSVQVQDPIKMFNVYGYGICSSHSCEVEALARHIGLKARGRNLRGHSVAEIYYNGAWHMVDPSLINFFRDTGGKITGVDEIVTAVKKWHRENPGMGNAGKLTRYMRNYGWKKGPSLLARSPHYNKNGWIANGTQGWYSTMLQYDGSRTGMYEYGYSQGYQVNIQLRSGERITRNWFNKGLHVNMAERAPSCLTKKILEGPQYGDIAPGRIGNGVHEYDVPLSTGPVRAGALVYSNLAAKSEDGRSPALHVSDPAKDGILVIRMPSSYVYLGGELSFESSVASGGAIAVAFSDNNGLDWKDVAEITSSGAQKIDLKPHVFRRYDYRLRFTMKGGRTGLDSLRLTHDIQHSQKALPALTQGKNTITFSAGPQEGTIVIEGNMSPRLAAGKQLTYLDFHPKLQDMGQKQMRPPYGKPGIASFPVATPGDMTRLRLSTHYRARDARDKYEVDVSFDDGKTFAKVGQLSGPVSATTKYMVFSAVPKNTRRALLRFTGTQRNTIVMMDMRISVDYTEPRGGFRPIKITYLWEENGVPRKDVHVAKRPRESYTIQCSAKPKMKSIVLELAK